MRNRRGRNRNQIENIAAVQGKFVRLPLLHHLAEGRSLGLQQRRLGRYFNRLADLANRQRRVDVSILLHLDRDIRPGEMLEARLLDVQAILAGYHVHKLVRALTTGDLSMLFLGSFVGKRDLSAG